ncbi:hypothetical protein LWI28_018079 [Acer negundo]|uniref:Uncharacterized protein n=1 Tax=Acer negundo TaxID=4023 RepID=A0AAD5JTD0_ACENE|nr:hypothetical protein LWI28_018079 [Acer negundo]KAK4853057.1 hypothetical protein QYF36_003094 [Acer negundo]
MRIAKPEVWKALVKVKPEAKKCTSTPPIACLAKIGQFRFPNTLSFCNIVQRQTVKGSEPGGIEDVAAELLNLGVDPCTR